MPFHFSTTDFDGLSIIHAHEFADARGAYIKYYESGIFEENGIKLDFSEISEIYSEKGALRGLHFQNNPSQAKLIHVSRGEIFDVAVDLRSDSLTFGKYKTFRLKEKEHIAVLIPAGFAHGFLSLEDSIFSYQSIGTYVPENCSGIIWNDKELNIPWPVDEIKCPLIISEKDKVLQTFLEYKQHNNR